MSELIPRTVTVTFIIRDTSPFIHMQEPIKKRAVNVHLTQEQRELLALKKVGTVRKEPIYEELADCFFYSRDKE